MHCGKESVAIILALVCWTACESQAHPLTVVFEGYIDFIHDYVELDDSVFVGVPFSGSYTFDPKGKADQYPDNSQIGFYSFGPAGRIRAQVGNYEFITADAGLLIWNDFVGQDLYEPISTTPFEAGGYQWSVMSILLVDESHTALTNDALLTTTSDLGAFPDFHGLLLDLPGDTNGIRGVLTSLTPEPDCLAILGLGVGFFAAWGRRG